MFPVRQNFIIAIRAQLLTYRFLIAINEEDILTPWPRSISEYTYVSRLVSPSRFVIGVSLDVYEKVTTIKDTDDTVASFWSSYGKQVEEGEEKPKEFWFATTLKAMSLLHTAQK